MGSKRRELYADSRLPIMPDPEMMLPKPPDESEKSHGNWVRPALWIIAIVFLITAVGLMLKNF